MNFKLNLKYSTSQILFCTTICIVIGFASVYLLYKGFSNSIIGVILALGNLISAFLQPLLAEKADKLSYKSFNGLVRWLLLINTALSLILYFLDLSIVWVGIVFTAVITLNLTVTPLLSSLSFSFESLGYKINFGLARGLGSAAYAVFSFILGYVTVKYTSLLPLLNAFVNILCIIVLYFYTAPGIESVVNVLEDNTQINVIEFFKKYKKFMFLILGAILVTFGHTLINNFFIQVIGNINGDSSDMGKAIFIAAIVELPVMMFIEKIIKKIKIEYIIKFSLLMFAVKHLLTYFAFNVFMIYVAQAIQVFAYALFLPAGVYYVQKVIEKSDQIKGQSFMNLSFTVSGALASIVGGVLLDRIGVSSTLLISAVISFVGVLIAVKNV